MAKNEEEVIAYVKRKLGLGITDVELTDDQMEDVIDDTKRWFAHRLGQQDVIRLDLIKGQTQYQLPAHVIEVTAVRFPDSSLSTNALGTDDFSFAYSYLFGSWYTNTVGSGAQGTNSYYSSPYPYSDLLGRLQYLETIGRMWGADIEEIYDKRTRMLNTSVSPIIAGSAFIEIWTSIIDPSKFDPEDEDFFLRWALAEAKDTLGRVRSKYDAYPSVGGERLMNGDTLLAESVEEKERLDAQVLLRRRSVPIVFG